MTARDDTIEVGEVGREVERETVAHHRTVQLDSDRGQLFAAVPDARETWPPRLGFDAQLLQVIDDRLFQLLQVARDG
jgi:hypothetical protein